MEDKYNLLLLLPLFTSCIAAAAAAVTVDGIVAWHGRKIL